MHIYNLTESDTQYSRSEWPWGIRLTRICEIKKDKNIKESTLTVFEQLPDFRKEQFPPKVLVLSLYLYNLFSLIQPYTTQIKCDTKK